VIGRRVAVAPVLGTFAALLSTGCGVTRLQSARPTPRGETRTTIAGSLVHMGDRGFDVGGVKALPLDIMVRHGATDRVDWGIRLFFGIGVLGDVKWNLLDPARATAVSISAGAGGAVEASAKVLHVPLTVSASHSFRPWFTPYAAVGYGTYWIFGYGERRSGVSYADRWWTGDSLITLHTGLELSRATGRAVLLEYSVGLPAVNDPGDFYGFATNHFFSIAIRTGRNGFSSR
jgi:hypothetical protein